MSIWTWQGVAAVVGRSRHLLMVTLALRVPSRYEKSSVERDIEICIVMAVPDKITQFPEPCSLL